MVGRGFKFFFRFAKSGMLLNLIFASGSALRELISGRKAQAIVWLSDAHFFSIKSMARMVEKRFFTTSRNRESLTLALALVRFNQGNYPSFLRLAGMLFPSYRAAIYSEILIANSALDKREDFDTTGDLQCNQSRARRDSLRVSLKLIESNLAPIAHQAQTLSLARVLLTFSPGLLLLYVRILRSGFIGALEPASNHTHALRWGVMSYRHPFFASASTNIGDYVQSLAPLAALLSRNVDLVDSSISRRVLERMREHLTQVSAATQHSPVCLVDVPRDASSIADIPENTWLVANGWFSHQSRSGVYDFPFHKNVIPIFISVHIASEALLTEDGISYLKKYGPIGCRDWRTVELLISRGVPAFFSGCLTMTLGKRFQFGQDESGSTVNIDVIKDESKGGKQIAQLIPRMRFWNVSDGVGKAFSWIEVLAKSSLVRTSRLHSALPAFSLGTSVEFTPRDIDDTRFNGLLGLSADKSFEQISNRANSILESVLDFFLEGITREEFIIEWKKLTSGFAEESERISAKRNVILNVNELDIKHPLLKHVNDRPNTNALSVAFVFDRNLLPVLRNTVRSLVVSNPWVEKIYIVGRGFDLIDVRNSLPVEVWESVVIEFFSVDDYVWGDTRGLLTHTSASALDRLLLPSLLEEESKVLYLDLDLIVRRDVSYLCSVDLSSTLIAGKRSYQAGWSSQSRLAKSVEGSLTASTRDRFNLFRDSYPGPDYAVNAGVLLMNLRLMREESAFKSVNELVTEFGIHDQHFLNMTGRGRIAVIPDRYNYVPGQDFVEDPAIVHWAGTRKPWMKGWVPFQTEWRLAAFGSSLFRGPNNQKYAKASAADNF